MTTAVIPEEFCDRYIQLCTTPLNTTESIKEQLDLLLSNPLISDVTFFDDVESGYDTLMVGTRAIVVWDRVFQVNRYLGKFIIYLTRKRQGRRWHVEFNLHNIDSRPSELRTDPYGVDYLVELKNPHPHMFHEPRIHPRFGEVASLCISIGGFQVYQALRRGNMHLATELVLQILHSLGPGHAYLNVSCWPVYQPEVHDV